MRRLLPLLLLLLPSAAPAPTAPPASAAPAPFRAVLLSDFNGPYGATTYPAPLKRVMDRVLNEWRPDLLLSAGDVIGGQKASLPDERRRAMWAAFDRDVAAPLRNAGIPFAFAVGNHDGSSAGGPGRFAFAADRAALEAYWTAPGHAPALDFVDRSRFPFAYTFVFRGVFFAVVDASSAELQDRAWLEAQLASPTARAAAMRVVVGHLPLFGLTVGRSKAGEVLRGGDDLRAAFERLGVHSYVSGHHAAFYPGRRGKLNLLASGGIGGRDFVGFPGTARSTVTVLEVDPAARVVRWRTHDADTGKEVAAADLPARIDGYGGSITRTGELRP